MSFGVSDENFGFCVNVQFPSAAVLLKLPLSLPIVILPAIAGAASMFVFGIVNPPVGVLIFTIPMMLSVTVPLPKLPILFVTPAPARVD